MIWSRLTSKRRFEHALASYGADLRRWPQRDRDAASAILASKPDMHHLVEEAERFDQAVVDDLVARDRHLWGPGEQDAALTRLRAGVHGRIGASRHAARQPVSPMAVAGWTPGFPRAGGTLTLRLGTATAGGLAVAAGLWIGWLQVVQPSPIDLLGLLQAGPLGPLGW